MSKRGYRKIYSGIVTKDKRTDMVPYHSATSLRFQEHFFGPPRFWTVIFPEEIVYFRTFAKGRRNIDKISHVCIYTTSNALSLALVNDMNHPTVIFGPPALATTYCNLMLDLIGIMPSPLHFVVKDIYKYHAAFDFFFFCMHSIS